MAKLQVFDGAPGKVLGFIMAYKLCIRMKMRGIVAEKQIQWILLYIQGGVMDFWKENTLEDLEGELLEYEMVEEFFKMMKIFV